MLNSLPASDSPISHINLLDLAKKVKLISRQTRRFSAWATLIFFLICVSKGDISFNRLAIEMALLNDKSIAKSSSTLIPQTRTTPITIYPRLIKMDQQKRQSLMEKLLSLKRTRIPLLPPSPHPRIVKSYPPSPQQKSSQTHTSPDRFIRFLK